MTLSLTRVLRAAVGADVRAEGGSDRFSESRRVAVALDLVTGVRL